MAYLIKDITLSYIEKMAAVYPKHRVVYAVQSCWWKIGDPVYRIPDGPGKGLPCGPRREMLMECNDLAGFLKVAKDNPEHYGKHGITAFVAAHHGNLMADNGNPTSSDSWNEYNRLIDEAEGG